MEFRGRSSTSGAVKLSCSFPSRVKSKRWPTSCAGQKIAKKYSIAPRDREALLALLHAEAVLLPDEPGPGVCRGPDDDRLLGCAAARNVDYLVTGELPLLAVGQYRGVIIVDGRQFLGVLSGVVE